jgi:RNA polymerase sigma factor (sigma-70 family)
MKPSTLRPEDKALVDRIRKGEYEVLDELYASCFPKVREEVGNPQHSKVYLEDVLIKIREDVLNRSLVLTYDTLEEHIIGLCRERFEKAQENTKLDQKVIECLKEQDGWSFYYMQRMYFPSVYALVRMQGGSKQDAEDVIMDGIQALLQNIEAGKYEVQDTARLKTYFLRICRNIWVDEVKRKSRTRVVRPLDDLNSDDLKFLAYYDNYESENLTDRQKLVQTVFSDATETCKRVLGYFYYENLSHDEIAARMGYKNSDTCKTQKMKCLTKLKTAVKSRFERLITHKPHLAD